jgi:Family of unknown function (DUF6893)
MTYIRIPLPVLIAVLLAAIAAAVGAQLPEIQRYLKVRQM